MSLTLTIREAAGQLRVSERTLRREIADGKLRATKDGRITQEEFDGFLRACRQEAKRQLDEMPKHEQSRIYWEARLGPNASHDALLKPENVRANKTLFPYSGPAVYFLFHGDEIVYVGQTTNLWSRLSSHSKDKIFDHFSYIACSEEELLVLERRAILKFRPKLNRL